MHSNAPEILLYSPFGQKVQLSAPIFENVPGSQIKQSEDPGSE